MARSWIIDGRGIAKKVRSATLSFGKQIKDCGARRECPKCHYWIDNSDVPYEWPGLPVGVKFDPSDAELLEHLAAKCGVGIAKPHMFIDEFIPTLEREKGICYTHPKDLPGAKKDGSSIHFFHKTTNAYASGQRKRRKILSEQTEESVRWHKTGKTKPVIDNGVQKGCKKIMVLYRSSKKGSKPVKSNWVMHQYHLGSEEDEKDEEYVVSKIFYQQPKQGGSNDDRVVNETTDVMTLSTGPKTPKTNTPDPPRFGKPLLCDEVDLADDNTIKSTAQVPEYTSAGSCPSLNVQPKEDIEHPKFLAGESQAIDSDLNGIDDPLLCKEIFSACAPLVDSLDSMNNITGPYDGSCGISDLENLELDTPPDFQLAFGSQDSIFGWLDRL
ncbi:hypothetical protein Ancab_026948 [Ancistrocladus abbreviatus]